MSLLTRRSLLWHCKTSYLSPHSSTYSLSLARSLPSTLFASGPRSFGPGPFGASPHRLADGPSLSLPRSLPSTSLLFLSSSLPFTPARASCLNSLYTHRNTTWTFRIPLFPRQHVAGSHSSTSGLGHHHPGICSFGNLPARHHHHCGKHQLGCCIVICGECECLCDSNSYNRSWRSMLSQSPMRLHDQC